MPVSASVNYHVHSPERQAFRIDADGIVGNLISPELVATDVVLLDVRADEATVSFDADGVEFAQAPTKVTSFEGESGWQGTYDAEVTALLQKQLGAKEVVIFDHTQRIDDPKSDRKPARNVHSDYSPEGAERRLVDILGAERASYWQEGHFAFINVWRPVDNPINSAPLGFVRPSSVEPEDWILIDLIYPDRLGHIMGLVANASHEWVYQSRMTPDEVVVFNIYDNQGRPSVGHSAVDRIENPTLSFARKSLETRTLVRL